MLEEIWLFFLIPLKHLRVRFFLINLQVNVYLFQVRLLSIIQVSPFQLEILNFEVH